MEILKESIVRFKSNLNQCYLIADQDAETITLSRDGSSTDACWYVEKLDEKPEVIRLKSCQSGKYLCATDIPFCLDKSGKRVVQTYSESEADTTVIEWKPIKGLYQEVIMLKTSTGSFLQSNDASPPLKYFITHDNLLAWTMWTSFLWTLDVPETQMGMSSLYAFVDQAGGSTFSKLGEEGNSSVPIQTVKAGPLNRNRWSTLVLIINFIVKLRLLLKEAYKNQKMMKLHCYLFPSDYVFEREILVQLWMAAGYLRKGRMEEYGRRYFGTLLNEGLILPAKNEHVPGKYVTNVGEVANGLDKILKFKDGDLLTLLKEEHMEVKGANKPWHVSLTSRDINQTTFETLKRFNELRTLLFVTNYGSSLRQLPVDLFLALPCLEALDLSRSHITELPGSIGNMSQLHYLNLSFTLIESLPEAICRLQGLQTLNLEGCKRLYYLPKGFKKLINLRHLYFDVLGQLNFMPRDIGSLTELRTLSAFIVDVEKGCNIKELRYMNNLSGSCCIAGLENITLLGAREASLYYKRLRQLQLRWNDGLYNAPIFYMKAVSLLEPHPCLEELQMLHYPYPKLPRWICAEKFNQLCSITLRKCKVRNLDIHLGELPNLKCLDIVQMDAVEAIDRSICTRACGDYVSFPRLERLTIEGMLILNSWTGVKKRDFPVLSEFRIKDCPNLMVLPFIPFLGSLKLLEIGNCTVLRSLSNRKLPDKLETFMVDDCPLLIMSYSRKGARRDKIKHVPRVRFDLEDMHSVPGDGADSSVMREYRFLLSNFNQLVKNPNVSTDPMEDVNAYLSREDASFLENYGSEDEQKMALSEHRKLLDINDKNAEISLVEPSQGKTVTQMALSKLRKLLNINDKNAEISLVEPSQGKTVTQMALSKLRKLLNINDKNDETSLVEPSQGKTLTLLTQDEEHSKDLLRNQPRCIEVGRSGKVGGSSKVYKLKLKDRDCSDNYETYDDDARSTSSMTANTRAEKKESDANSALNSLQIPNKKTIYVDTDPMDDVNACILREEASFLENYGSEDEQKMALFELRKLLDIQQQQQHQSLTLLGKQRIDIGRSRF